MRKTSLKDARVYYLPTTRTYRPTLNIKTKRLDYQKVDRTLTISPD